MAHETKLWILLLIGKRLITENVVLFDDLLCISFD